MRVAATAGVALLALACLPVAAQATGEYECTAASELADALNSRGFAVIRSAFTASQAERAMAALQRTGGILTRDTIWLRKSERITQVLELDSVFAELLQLPPEVMHLFDSVLGPEFKIGSFHALLLHPEPTVNASARDRILRTNLHSDYPYGHATRFHGGRLSHVLPQWPRTMQLLWMLTDFTPGNGGTLLLPESHVDGSLPERLGEQSERDFRRFKQGAVSITGRAGDLLVYLGQTWHSIGVNQETSVRGAMLGQFLPFFMLPMEAHAWNTPMSVQRRLPEKTRKLLGMNWDFFFQHSFRLAPLPRGVLGGFHWLYDTLRHGYPQVHNPETLRQGVGLAELPPWSEWFVLNASPILLQLNRWLSLLAILAVPMCLSRFCVRKRQPPWHSAVFLASVVSLVIGLVLGCNLTLERLRM